MTLVICDVGYAENGATAACVVARDWGDGATVEEHVERIEEVEPYVPGEFFRRELPCIQRVLRKVETPADAIVIDGYVWLGSTDEPGLGAHLYEAIRRKVAVVGVAKNAYANAKDAIPVCRGVSQRPLFVTAAGILQEIAAALVKSMHGEHRIPTLIKRVDQLARGLRPPAAARPAAPGHRRGTS